MPQMHMVDQDGLTPMTRAAFPTENQLQDLLARFPDIMPGELVDPDSPRRWMLITREAGLAIGGIGAQRFSLDHLFLDQDGWPTLVEVKRASDTRGRREVVAQMLDYAASLRLWQPGQISEVFADRCRRDGIDGDALVDDLLDPTTTSMPSGQASTPTWPPVTCVWSSSQTPSRTSCDRSSSSSTSSSRGRSSSASRSANGKVRASQRSCPTWSA